MTLTYKYKDTRGEERKFTIQVDSEDHAKKEFERIKKEVEEGGGKITSATTTS